MHNNYVLYSSIWCTLEEIKDNIKKNRQLLKEMIESLRDYGDNEGFTFFELTEDALRNLPVLMVQHMKCFNQENIDTMVFNIKEIKLKEEYIESIKIYFEECLAKLSKSGFKAELVIVKETKIEEENIGKTVGRKDYEIYFYGQFQ